MMLKARKNAYFITVDGPDGCGKTTIVNYIQKRLQEVFNIPAMTTRGLGGSIAGSHIRDSILTGDTPCIPLEILGPPFSFIDTGRQIVEPAMAGGISVIADRWNATYFAYQVTARQSDIARDIFEHLLMNPATSPAYFICPDIQFICTVGIQEADRRIQARGGMLNHMDTANYSFKQDVHRGFDDYKKRYFNRIVDLDCNRPIEEVLAQVDKHLTLSI